jgi:hypothetical protein
MPEYPIISNPWERLPEKPDYVLPEDREAIQKYNERAGVEYKIRLNMFPVPYIGDVENSPVVLLQLNPGCEIPPGFDHPNDEYAYLPRLLELERENILHQPSEYPFIYLNPELRLSGGFRYWSKIMAGFLKSRDDYHRMANKISCIEFLPYHSKNYDHLGETLSSQQYGFHLVRNALNRGAKIIVMRNEKRWLQAVPELEGRFFKLNSARGAYISRSNMVDFEFQEIQRALQM